MEYPSRSWRYSIFSGGTGMKIGLVLALIAVLSFSGILISAGADADVEANADVFDPSFDMSGTITNVLTPSGILVGKEKVNLESVDSSGLNSATYAYLMQDLKEWLTSKDVFVKRNRVYFGLNDAFNSVSVNEMIQKEIANLRYDQYYNQCY